jgi:hypothetical protein
MDTPDIMHAIAEYLDSLKATLGIEGVAYPAPNSIPASPYVVLLDGNTEGPSVYERMFNGQEVQARITIRILVKSQKDRPREASRIDTLIAPVLDALDPQKHGGSANHILTGDDLGHIDRIWDRATVVRGSTEEYAGEFCYAADIGLDPYFRRQPGE